MSRILAVISEIRNTSVGFKSASEEATSRASRLNQLMSDLEANWRGVAQVRFYDHYDQDATQLARFGVTLHEIGVQLDHLADEFEKFDRTVLAEGGTLPGDPGHTGQTGGDDNGGSHHSGGVPDPGNGSNQDHGGGYSGGPVNTPQGPGGGPSSSQYGGSSDSSGPVIVVPTGGSTGSSDYADVPQPPSDGSTGGQIYMRPDATPDDIQNTDGIVGDGTAAKNRDFWGQFIGKTSDQRAGWGCVSYVLSSTFVPWTMVGKWNAGDAKEWVKNARKWNELHPEYEITIDHTPRKGAVAVFPHWGDGYGHVAKVTSANGSDYSFLQGNTFFGKKEIDQGHWYSNNGQVDVPYSLTEKVETSGYNEVWFIHFPWEENK